MMHDEVEVILSVPADCNNEHETVLQERTAGVLKGKRNTLRAEFGAHCVKTERRIWH
jgi:hypothetical protein